MTVAELDAFLRVEMPQLFHGPPIVIEHADGRACRLRQAYDEAMLRPGGTISGPTMMALSDFAMYVAVFAAAGPVPLAVTTSLNINFLRKPAQADLVAHARLLKHGKRLVVGEVEIFSTGSDEPVAHVTATYSIPPAG